MWMQACVLVISITVLKLNLYFLTPQTLRLTHPPTNTLYAPSSKPAAPPAAPPASQRHTPRLTHATRPIQVQNNTTNVRHHTAKSIGIVDAYTQVPNPDTARSVTLDLGCGGAVPGSGLAAASCAFGNPRILADQFSI
ncbi:uncharacterized protein K452DRAFT_292125 [Aplosporella prunicola CBS 121167]|uniref:Uncharacterized protein n=1 Tax=Aplosporella prunicola CBS 121167 TaxID=1176127 RepID=A0A6A6B0N7_9PEZI|nr:uncharacterized protein K452DRAFT_292125 [Aplosporella prunicola CBS 121167]KAF2136805.1 hypothetical protein K452DRAFT_292125 [Aplosporella prunicola CBS 121167]